MLEKVSIFAGLSPEEVEAIEGHAVIKKYRKNTVFIERGDEANMLYFIVEGLAKVYISDDDGREVVLNEQGPGTYLGELALLGSGSRAASAVTLEDSVFLTLTKQSLQRLIAEYPDIALNLIRDLALRVRSMADEVSALALLDVYGRIARLLTENAVPEGDRTVVGRMTHQDIATRVGASREMVSKILKDLRVGGYLSIEGKRFIIERPLPARW